MLLDVENGINAIRMIILISRTLRLSRLDVFVEEKHRRNMRVWHQSLQIIQKIVKGSSQRADGTAKRSIK